MYTKPNRLIYSVLNIMYTLSTSPVYYAFSVKVKSL